MNRKRICLVTSEIAGPYRNGGIGAHCYYLTQFLAKIKNWETTILYNGAFEKHDEQYWTRFFLDRFGAKFSWIHPNARETHNHWHAPTCHWDHISQLNYHFLIKHPQDVVLFQEMLGGGFRSIQAKRSLGCFASTELVVMAHSSWEWINQSMGCLPEYGFPEMMTKFMERYSVQYCDELISPSQYMLEWSKTDVGLLPRRTRVIPYLFEKDIDKVLTKPSAKEIIFFGRLEQRKGLVLFLKALSLVAFNKSAPKIGSLNVFFVGKSGRTEDGDGLATIEKFRSELVGIFNFNIQDDLGHEEALEFLRSHPSALVVCPSLQDNSPYAVIENLELGTNLIACATGGIPELFSGGDRLCRPEPQALAALIQSGLNGKLPRVKPAYSKENARKSWEEFLNSKQGLGWNAFQEKQVSRFQFAVIGGSRKTGRAKETKLSLANSSALLDSASTETHVLLINEKVNLAEDAMRILEKCAICDPSSIWTGFTKIKSSPETLYAPLGGCSEAALFGNVFGAAVALIPRDLLENKSPGFSRLLELAEREPEYFWPLLASFSLKNGVNIDVVPTIIAELPDKFCAEISQSSLALKLAVCEVLESYAPAPFARMFQYFVASNEACAASNHKKTEKRIKSKKIIEYFYTWCLVIKQQVKKLQPF